MLLPDCILPGCRNPVERLGLPCTTCLDEVGDFIQHNPDGVRPTAEELDESDRRVREIYAARILSTTR